MLSVTTLQVRSSNEINIIEETFRAKPYVDYIERQILKHLGHVMRMQPAQLALYVYN